MVVETSFGVGTFVDMVDKRLAEILPESDGDKTPLQSAMRYSALAPGKRLRPSLALAASVAVGGTAAQALDIGCALELIHCFSLIHDDLPCIDNDDLRRGRPTCHKVYGEAIAVLAGDALFALAFTLAARSGDRASITTKIIERLAVASGPEGLVGGEVMDILAEGAPHNLDELREIHLKKTAALISASCACGALVGGGSEAQVQELASFGEAIGLAFQIHDDVLNETSSPEQLGKAVGSDRERGKLTYPAVLGLEESKRLAEEATNGAIQILESYDQRADGLRQLAVFSVQRVS